jgi:hypothetical protein
MSANRAWIGDYLLQYLNPSNYRSPENGTHNPEPEIDDHSESMTEVVETEAVDVVTRTLTPPPVLPLAHNTTDGKMAAATPQGSVNVMDRVMSLHAYLAENEPPPQKTKSSAAQGAPSPRAVGARSSRYTIHLNELCQAWGVALPRFEFDGSESGWRGTVFLERLLRGDAEDQEFQDLVLEEKALSGSKQEVKEKLSEKAVRELEKLISEGKLEKKSKKKGQVGQAGVTLVDNKDSAPPINYVGQLLGKPTPSHPDRIYSYSSKSLPCSTHHPSNLVTTPQNFNAAPPAPNRSTSTSLSATRTRAKSPSKATPNPSAPEKPTSPPRKPRVKTQPATSSTTSKPSARGPTPRPPSAASGRRKRLPNLLAPLN